MDSIRNYLGEKEFRMSEILQFGIMFLLSGFLIGGGIIILNDEDIFKKIYEGYQEFNIEDNRPEEEKIIVSYLGTSNPSCPQGEEKYSATGFQGAMSYICAKCPDGRILKYSDGTLVSPGQLEMSKINLDTLGLGLSCKLADPIGPNLDGLGNAGYSDSVDTRPIIPNEEKLIGLYTVTQNRKCSEGEYKFESPQSNGTITYQCAKCPDGRILKYSDGTSVSSEEIDTTKLISNENQSGMRCKLPTQAQTTEVQRTSTTPTKTTVVRPTSTTVAAASQGAPAVSNTWTADLPDELLLVNLQKNVKLIRKKSLINTITAWTMIVLGSLISIYQIYNLFFS